MNISNLTTRLYRLLTLLCLTALVSACSIGSSAKIDSNIQFTDNGSLSIASSVPSAIDFAETQNNFSALGFMPIEFNNSWIEIDSKAGQLSLVRGTTKLLTEEIQTTDIKKGNYKVVLKDNNPVWLADDNYFIKRQMDIPSAYAPERFLKGILGDRAIFFEEGLILHTAAYNSSEIDGVQIAPSVMEEIFAGVGTDSQIIVR